MPSFTFPCTDDAEVASILPDEARGTTNPTGMNVGILVGSVFESYIRFDLFSQIPVGSTITVADLSLESAGVNGAPDIRFRALTGTTASWAEATITWNNRPTAVGAQSSSYTTTVKGLNVYSVIPVMQEMVTNNYPSGFRIDETIGVSDSTSYYTKENVGGGFPDTPKLDVTWTVPVGGNMMFLGVNNHLGVFEGGVDGNAMLLGFNPPTRM